MALYKDGSESLSIVFNATDSDNTNWFSSDRLLYSPWSDLNTEPHLFFSIEGTGFGGRNFYIMRNHNGCPGDTGWLMVTTLDACSWEITLPPARLFYSKLTTYAQMNLAGERTVHVSKKKNNEKL